MRSCLAKSSQILSDAFKFVILETKWRRQAKGQALIFTEAVETTLAVRRFLTPAAAENVSGRRRIRREEYIQVMVTSKRAIVLQLSYTA